MGKSSREVDDIFRVILLLLWYNYFEVLIRSCASTCFIIFNEWLFRWAKLVPK